MCSSAQLKREAAVLTIEFTKLSGGKVELQADGRNVGSQTQMVSVGLPVKSRTDWCSARRGDDPASP